MSLVSIRISVVATVCLIFALYLFTTAGAVVICIGACGSVCYCPTNYTFQCANGDCVNITAYRNGRIECRDKSDESCCSNQIQCDQSGVASWKCILASKVNDGVFDCADLSDEAAALTKECTALQAKGATYSCKTQATGAQVSKCISKSWILDGRYDCPLGDDENPALFDLCALKKNNCSSSATCSSGTSGTFTCTCNTGFSGNGFNCTENNPVLCSLVPNVNRYYQCQVPTGTSPMCVKLSRVNDGTKDCPNGDDESITLKSSCVVLQNCDPNANCVASASGSYSCACNTGYSGTGITCTGG